MPVNAWRFSCAFLLVGVALLYAGDSIVDAFTTVTTIASVCFMVVWTMILASYLVYRRRRPTLHEASSFRMPGGSPMAVAVLAFFVFVLVALTLEADTRWALSVTPAWFVVLAVAYGVARRRTSGSSGAGSGPRPA